MTKALVKVEQEEQKPHAVAVGDRPPGSFTLKREAFITGSHAYGTPTDKSDVDLVIRCSDDTRRALVKLLIDTDDADGIEYGSGCCQFKVGKLNLILCDTDIAFGRWAAGTMVLQMQAPVSRAEAVKLFKAVGVGT